MRFLELLSRVQFSISVRIDHFTVVGLVAWPLHDSEVGIDLLSLYVLFSHFRPRDATRGNSFFQMSSYARANVRITNDKNKRKIPMRASRGLKWENKMYKLKRSIELVLIEASLLFNVNRTN